MNDLIGHLDGPYSHKAVGTQLKSFWTLNAVEPHVTYLNILLDEI